MIRSPLRSPLNPVLSAVGNRSRSAAYNPATLFAASEQGVWYDPSDLSTMFQDSAGSTPVTAVGQPVGLLLDKSKGLVRGPETLSTPSFAAGLGDWFQSSGAVGAVTWDAAGFVLLRDIGGADGRMRIHTTWVVGATYEVIVKFKRSDGLVLLYAGDRGSGSTDLTIFIASGPIATPVTVKAIFKSSFVSGSLSIMQAGYDISSEIISVSVRELPGNHAKQATPTARPVLSARVNLLTKTEDLGVAPWANVQGASSYVGGKIVPAATTLIHGRRYSRSLVAGRQVTASAYVKAGEAGVNLEFWNYVSTGAVVNLTTWVVTAVTNCTVFLGDFDGDGYRMVSFTFTEETTTNNNTDFRVTRSTLRDQQFVGDGSSGYFLKNPQVEIGAVATIYQRVNTDTDYDTVGFPHYLAFDGVDDSMATAAINFTATDKMSVFAGVRKNANNDGMIWELSGNTGAGNPGSFYMLAPSGSTGYLSKLGGNATDNTRASTGQVPPTTNVLSNLFDMAGVAASDEHVLRINGVATGTIAGTAAGTGNFGNYPLYIGARAGTGLYFNGRLYSLIVRGALSDAAQIAAAEAYVAGKTGVTL